MKWGKRQEPEPVRSLAAGDLDFRISLWDDPGGVVGVDLEPLHAVEFVPEVGSEVVVRFRVKAVRREER